MSIPLHKFISDTDALRQLTDYSTEFNVQNIGCEVTGVWINDQHVQYVFPRFNNTWDAHDVVWFSNRFKFPINESAFANSYEQGRKFSSFGKNARCVVSDLRYITEAGSPFRFLYNYANTGRPETTSKIKIQQPLLVHINGDISQSAVASKGTKATAAKQVKFLNISEMPTTYYLSIANWNGKSNGTFAVDSTSPLFAHIVRNNILMFIPTTEQTFTIVATNQINLSTTLFAGICGLIPDKVATILKDGVFLEAVNQTELRKLLLRAEGMLSPDQLTVYEAFKTDVQAYFEQNSAVLMLARYKSGELPRVEIRDITLTADSATYDRVSIQSPLLKQTAFKRLQIGVEFDIYQIIDNFTTYLCNEVDNLRLNNDCTAFAEEKAWEFSINRIPIKFSVSNTNTRRQINGHYINSAEVLPVIRRAACFQNADDYEKFLTQIEYESLRIHSALANGVPVKVFVFDNYSGYREKITNKYPKLRFESDGKKHYYIWVDEEKTQKLQICKFVEFLNKVDVLNNNTVNGGVPSNDPDYQVLREKGITSTNTEWLKFQLRKLIRTYTVSKKVTAGATDAQLDLLVKSLLSAREKAEKRSKELLDSVVKNTGSIVEEKKGVQGYKVVGKLRTYFVEGETGKVWDYNNLSHYVCIVNGQGEMGIGYDMVVARIMALKNDNMFVDKITTLNY